MRPEQLELPLRPPAEKKTRSRPGRKPRQLLKWAGSKASMIGALMPRTPASFAVYHEPFVGSGALFFALRPRRAYLSDLNAELINVFEVVRDTPAELIAALEPHVNSREHYQRTRAIHPDSLDPIARAARTLYLNRTGFNGLYRVNSRGLFNVPYGRMKVETFVAPEVIWRSHEALADASLRTCDVAAAAAVAERGDFVYLDPPYTRGLGGSHTHHYQAGGFDDSEHRRLAQLARDLGARGCRVMVSHAECELVRELYQGFRVDELSVRRRVGPPGRRGVAGELLIRNYGPSDSRGE
jgi:DNA adenine methylase